MHGLLGVELPLEEVGDLRQVSQVKLFLKIIHFSINSRTIKDS
jgi:hypothetical protein